MQNTTNYSLLLPDEDDFYSVGDMNSNTKIVDTQMKSNQNAIEEVTNNYNAHAANKSNPHGVTKTQVGLSNVPNVTTNNQTPTYTEPTSLSALVSGELLSVAFGKLSRAVLELISHIGNKSNPHGVTKAQIGLGSVENTSDANKPISTATRTALNLKADASTLTSHTGNNIMHVTSAERSLWNSKADGVLLHSRIPQYYNVKTQAELDAVMNEHSTNLAINTYYNFTLSVAVSGLSLMGGTYYVEGMKTSADYEWQRMTKYPNGNTLPPLLITGRSKFAGVWTAWENVAMQSEVAIKQNAATAITTSNIANQTVKYATSAGGVAWTNVTSKPASYPPSTHTHDDRYYTETEVNNLLEQRVHIGMMANNRLSFQWIDATGGELKVLIDGIDMGTVTLSKG